MKKYLGIAVFVFAIAGCLHSPVSAGTLTDFEDYVTRAGLKPFAKDIGGLLGGADFNSGRAIGFPGFDAGLYLSGQFKPSPSNVILKDSGVKAFAIPMIKVSAALPVIGADISLRGLTYAGFSILGAGVSYPVFKSGTLTMFIPDVSVMAYYDTLDFDYFKGTHMSFDAAASLNTPIIKPFIGFGYDSTKIEAQGLGNIPAKAGLNGISATGSGERISLGAKLVPFPFLYVTGAYVIAHGQPGMQLSLGARF